MGSGGAILAGLIVLILIVEVISTKDPSMKLRRDNYNTTEG